jgi:hypothetical protein
VGTLQGMSSQPPYPPHQGGQPPNQPPNQPPHGGPPPAQAYPQQPRSRMPWIVAGAILVVLLVVGGVVVALTGGDAESVQDVADQSVEAAEDLDIDAGFDLFCTDPGSDAREELDRMVQKAQDRAGTDDPDVDYEITDVKGDEEGSYHVTASSDEQGISRDRGEATVIVESRDGRSCIADVEDVDTYQVPPGE